MITAGERVGDRYELRRLLGTGGTGEVWLAHDDTLGRDVALKVVNTDVEPDRLAREARAAARVTHPSVVAVHDAGTVDGRGYLVMEYVDGVDLGAVLRGGGPLAPALLVAVVRDLAAALAAIHAAGLVHRDVTPGNLVVTGAGVVKVTDLGTARVVADDGVDRITRTGIVVGTVDYLAPEQLSPEPVGPAADVYAAGLVLRTLATGERPFGGGTVAERAARRLTEDPRPPTGVPDWVTEVVVACCHRDPAARPPDGAALVDAVDRLVPPLDDDARGELAARVVAAGRHLDDGREDTAELAPVADARTTVLDQDETDTVAVPDASIAAAAAGPAADRGATVPPPRGGRAGRRGRRGPLLVGLLAVAAVAVAIAVQGGVTPATAVPITDVADHDPQGDDGRERPGAVGLAIDDDTTTAWSTVGYRSADLGGLKDGVGLVLDLGEEVTVREVELALAVDDVTVEVWVTPTAPDGAPGDAQGATLLGSREDAAGTVRVAGRASGRWVTVWFTMLGPDDGDYRAGVADVEVRA